MMAPRLGSYVQHAKLPELGSGEIVAMDGPKIAIRFASGQRTFVYDLVEKHLSVVTEAPAAPPAKAARKPRAAKPAR
jgi:hypothetical protein